MGRTDTAWSRIHNGRMREDDARCGVFLTPDAKTSAAVTTITSLVQAQFGLVSAGRLPAISWAIKQGETRSSAVPTGQTTQSGDALGRTVKPTFQSSPCEFDPRHPLHAKGLVGEHFCAAVIRPSQGNTLGAIAWPTSSGGHQQTPELQLFRCVQATMCALSPRVISMM